jgi:hypothetical protein
VRSTALPVLSKEPFIGLPTDPMQDDTLCRLKFCWLEITNRWAIEARVHQCCWSDTSRVEIRRPVSKRLAVRSRAGRVRLGKELCYTAHHDQ